MKFRTSFLLFDHQNSRSVWSREEEMSFKDYMVRKLSTKKARLSQILSAPPLMNTKRLSDVFRYHILDRTGHIPPLVDLRSHMAPVENQLNIGSR